MLHLFGSSPGGNVRVPCRHGTGRVFFFSLLGDYGRNGTTGGQAGQAGQAGMRGARSEKRLPTRRGWGFHTDDERHKLLWLWLGPSRHQSKKRGWSFSQELNLNC